ncbi:MAG: hypothetical protein DMG10_31415, partial [Acidobacteria bacterium]
STSAPYSVISGSPFSLAAGASQAVVVRFSPTATGTFTGNVSFTSNGGNVSPGVTGVGTASPPQISVTPASQNFGTVSVGSFADLTFTVQDTGGSALTGSASTSAPFSVVSGTPFSLGAGTSQTIVVRFAPTATGSFTGNVSFTSNGGNVSPVVSGTGAQITVVSPNGGEVLHINHNVTLKWTSSGLSGNVNIDLSRDGGSNWAPILSSTPNDGKQVWRVTGPATTLGRIRVCNLGGTVCDTSNANFTIQP